MKRILLITFSAFVLFFGFQQESETRTETDNLIQASELRDSSARAIKLMQRSQAEWFQKQVCTSCHHQLIPEIAINKARTRGVPVDEKFAREHSTSSFAYLKDIDAAVQGYDFIDTLFDSLSLTVAGFDGIRPSLSTSAYAQFIASRQLENGSWVTFDSRPPQAHSLFTATALGAQAIRTYLPAQLKAEKERRLKNARDWLTKTQPRLTEDRIFQLLGLHWAGADQKAKAEAARGLLAEQREDGGWAQMPSMSSDSYATGEALFALREAAGLATTDAAYQRGLRFLLKTQEPDGSWRIKTRLHPPAPVSPPYFDAGFPYEHDQFISIMGTSWAVVAMLEALPEPQWAKLQPAVSLDVAPAEQDEWMRVSLEGSAADLKKLLDRGMNPNSKTAGGTTALMMVARDAEKVRLLVARGADVNARSATGLNALMLAARFRGNVETVRLLLAKGAKPNTDKGVEVRNNATALVFAAMAGDARTAGALLDAGARVEDRMKVLGIFATRPMNYATFIGDAAMVDYLISKGSNPNELDDDGMSVLASAAINNHANVVQVLLARGAQVNYMDKRGMTPLLYAASIDFGDTAVIEKLIAGGADLKAKNKQGMTALDLANGYNHRAQVSLLATKTASR